jgi:WD40 repeat protein
VVTPDGGTAVTSCFGGVKLWALPEGTLRTSLGGYDTGMIDLAIDAAGRTMAGGAQGTVNVWTLPGPRRLATFKTVGPGESALGTVVALTPDGKTLVSAGFGQPLQLWAVAAGAQPTTLDASEPTDVTDLAVSPDGSTLAAGYGNGTVRLWSLKERRAIANRHEHGFPVNGVEFSADGRWLVSASSDQTVKVWALPEATVRHTLRGHANEVFAVAVSRTGLIASADRNGVVHLWDLVSGADKGTLVDPALR